MVAIFIFQLRPVQNEIGITISFLHPTYWGDLEVKWNGNSQSAFLLKKLDGNNDFWKQSVASYIDSWLKEKRKPLYQFY